MTQKNPTRRAITIGGGGWVIDFDRPLDDWWIGILGHKPRLALIPTATGDERYLIDKFTARFANQCASIEVLRLFERTEDDLDAFFEDVDMVHVLGGNTASMLAVWRAHGVDRALELAYRRGVVMTGISAGAICWGTGGITDSFGSKLQPFVGGLRLLDKSFNPHYDDPRRANRAILGSMWRVAEGHPSPLVCLPNGTAVLWENEKMHQCVSARPHARSIHLFMPDDTIKEKTCTQIG